MASHVFSNEYKDNKGKLPKAEHGKATDDKNVIFRIAGNIKYHVEKQLYEPALQAQEMKYYAPIKHASEWKINNVYALRILFHPLSALDDVFPFDLEPNDKQMEEVSTLLQDNMNEDFFLTPSLSWQTSIAKDKGLRPVITALNCLLSLSRDETFANKDKEAIYTGAMLRDLFKYMGVGDPFVTHVMLEEAMDITTTLGAYRYHSKVDFGLTSRLYFGRNNALAFACVEDKCLNSNEQQIFSQRAAEALALANINFDDKDQEVFGICVHYRYFTFWKGIFPAYYLQCIRRDPTLLKGNKAFALMKCYPPSNFGLDVCDPAQRKEIVRAIFRVFNYIDKDYLELTDKLTK